MGIILLIHIRKISAVSPKFIRTQQNRESQWTAISKQLYIVDSKKGISDYQRDLHWWRSIASISRVNQCLTCQSEAGQLLLVVLHGCFTVGNFESRFSLQQICMFDIPSRTHFSRIRIKLGRRGAVLSLVCLFNSSVFSLVFCGCVIGICRSSFAFH